MWEIQPEFKEDVFTFVRIQYDADGPFGWWDRWDNDYPDGDWNFSFRLQQLTSLRVAPDSKVLRLTDPELYKYPFVYMAGVHWMRLSPDEQAAVVAEDSIAVMDFEFGQAVLDVEKTLAQLNHLVSFFPHSIEELFQIQLLRQTDYLLI